GLFLEPRTPVAGGALPNRLQFGRRIAMDGRRNAVSQVSLRNIKETHRMRFVKGQTGNPAGRPIGARNKKTLLLEAMLEAEGEGVTRDLIAQALAGDPHARR